MRPLLFQLLGHGIRYSASPAMMSAAFEALGSPHRYTLLDVPADDVPATLAQLRTDPEIGGANVTTPHKVAVGQLVDARAPEAERVGAVNTVVRDGSRLVGHNTDLPALVDAVQALCDGAPTNAVVLGAGGAARAVSVALEVCGARDVLVVSRSGGDGAARPWSALADTLRQADLLVNATPVGTQGDESPVPVALHRVDLAVLDLVYRPSPTRLVREARAAGARAAAGAGVLLGQGWRSLELWLGTPAPVDAMRAALRRELGPDADV